MWRWTIPFLLAVATVGPALAADLARVPDAHYRTRMTAVPPAPVRPVEENADLLFTPTDGIVRTLRPFFSGPLLPGSSTLPGYYGSSHSYDYQGPYYDSPRFGYWNRLPYACGVYGYC